jgi:histone deacetylase complex regulatory component SIN3
MDFKLGYYNALLKLIDRFFDDELDQHVFEECARYIFGTKAYIMFTIDKLMLSIMRQVIINRTVYMYTYLTYFPPLASSHCHGAQGSRTTITLQKEP